MYRFDFLLFLGLCITETLLIPCFVLHLPSPYIISFGVIKKHIYLPFVTGLCFTSPHWAVYIVYHTYPSVGLRYYLRPMHQADHNGYHTYLHFGIGLCFSFFQHVWHLKKTHLSTVWYSAFIFLHPYLLLNNNNSCKKHFLFSK